MMHSKGGDGLGVLQPGVKQMVRGVLSLLTTIILSAKVKPKNRASEMKRTSPIL